MPKIIFGSRKGGTGKTTCAHTLAAGLSLLQQRAVMVTVDLRPVRGAEGRPYGILDGREESRLVALLERELASDEWLIFDLGATRTGAKDTALADFVDLFICPVSPDLEALEIGVDYLNQHPSVVALPSIWPTNARAAQVDSYILDTLNQHHPSRVLAPMVQAHATKMFLENQWIPEAFTTPLRNTCRALARQVTERIAAPAAGA
jgi:hypothetical protein